MINIFLKDRANLFWQLDVVKRYNILIELYLKEKKAGDKKTLKIINQPIAIEAKGLLDKTPKEMEYGLRQ